MGPEKFLSLEAPWLPRQGTPSSRRLCLCSLRDWSTIQIPDRVLCFEEKYYSRHVHPKN